MIQESGPRALFLGMTNEISRRALMALLVSDIDLCGVVMSIDDPVSWGRSDLPLTVEPPASPSELPLVKRFANESIAQIAWEQNIPLHTLSAGSLDSLRSIIASTQSDIVCVACFPSRITASLLREPRHGFINLHPSMLPAHRGPHPLFWIFRSEKQESSGVTVHLMDEGLDTGDIVLQKRIVFPSGLSGPEADARCGEVGGNLLAHAALGLHKGALEPRSQSQDGSYEPQPMKTDFSLEGSWSALRAYNFMCGTAHWDQIYTLGKADKELRLDKAIEVIPDGVQEEPVIFAGDVVFMQFTPGILEARLA